MIHSDELSHESTLRYFEGLYEDADKVWRIQRSPETWERVTDLARIINGHCAAYGLVPSVGGLA